MDLLLRFLFTLQHPIVHHRLISLNLDLSHVCTLLANTTWIHGEASASRRPLLMFLLCMLCSLLLQFLQSLLRVVVMRMAIRCHLLLSDQPWSQAAPILKSKNFGWGKFSGLGQENVQLLRYRLLTPASSDLFRPSASSIDLVCASHFVLQGRGCLEQVLLVTILKSMPAGAGGCLTPVTLLQSSHTRSTECSGGNGGTSEDRSRGNVSRAPEKERHDTMCSRIPSDYWMISLKRRWKLPRQQPRSWGWYDYNLTKQKFEFLALEDEECCQ
jgi:hypothetical protein